jgi:hypothetical protein
VGEENASWEIQRSGWECDIKPSLREIVCEGVDWIRSCKGDNRTYGSTQVGNFLTC